MDNNGAASSEAALFCSITFQGDDIELLGAFVKPQHYFKLASKHLANHHYLCNSFVYFQTASNMKVFKQTIKLTFLFLAILTCHSCNDKSTKPTDFDAISETLSNHKATIIFVGTSWCAATQHTIKNHVIPYLSNPEEGIGFVLIYFGTLNDIPEHLLENTTLIEMESLGGMDKMIANRKLNKVLNDYKRVNYVPFSILTDQQGNILNYNSNKKRYSGISEIKWQIENL